MNTQTIDQQLTTIIRELSAPMIPEPTLLQEKVRPLNNIKAVLFDVYGTLFISGAGDVGTSKKSVNKHALHRALVDCGFTGQLDQASETGIQLLNEAIQEFHTARKQEGIQFPEVEIREIWKTVIQQLVENNWLDNDYSETMLMKLALEFECLSNPVWPMPNLKKTLQRIKQKNILLGILSNAQFYTPLLFPAFMDGSHEELGFNPDLCAWSYQFLEAKPSIRLFDGILTRLEKVYKILPKNTLYVGNDMLKDIWPANQLGCQTAFFAGDKRSLRLHSNNPECKGINPDLVLNNLIQLSEALDSMNSIR